MANGKITKEQYAWLNEGGVPISTLLAQEAYLAPGDIYAQGVGVQPFVQALGGGGGGGGGGGQPTKEMYPALYDPSRQQPQGGGLGFGLYGSYNEAAIAAPTNYIPMQDPSTGYWYLAYKAPKEKEGEVKPEGLWTTYAEALAAAPEGYIPTQRTDGWWGLEWVGTGLSAEDIRERQYEEQYRQGQLQHQQAQLSAEQQYWQQQLAWQREQATMQQAEQERQYRAQLASQPISWLQYAAYTGETPVVQPWMLPLMTQGYSAGEQIPGWTQESTGGMPALRSPSAQLWARMGPTAQQQYMGYKQARTGQRPEETEFRMRAQAPPAGSYAGLRWLR